MTKQSLIRGSALLAAGLLGLGLSGCARDEGTDDVDNPTPVVAQPENRGVFGDGSCASGDRIPLPDTAVYAAYFDSSGKQLSPTEDLAGTQDGKICPFAIPENVPGNTVSCAPKCPLTLGRKTYCVPPPCP